MVDHCYYPHIVVRWLTEHYFMSHCSGKRWVQIPRHHEADGRSATLPQPNLPCRVSMSGLDLRRERFKSSLSSKAQCVISCQSLTRSQSNLPNMVVVRITWGCMKVLTHATTCPTVPLSKGFPCFQNAGHWVWDDFLKLNSSPALGLALRLCSMFSVLERIGIQLPRDRGIPNVSLHECGQAEVLGLWHVGTILASAYTEEQSHANGRFLPAA